MVKFNPNHQPFWVAVYAGLTTVVGMVAYNIVGGQSTSELQDKYPEDKIKRHPGKAPYNEKELMASVLMGKGEADLSKLREQTTQRRLELAQAYRDSQEKEAKS